MALYFHNTYTYKFMVSAVLCAVTNIDCNLPILQFPGCFSQLNRLLIALVC